MTGEAPTAGGTLFERQDELHRLSELAAAARGGQGSVVVVEGQAGIGKTALLAALRRSPAVGRLRCLSACGSEFEQDFAFGVVRQLLDPVLRSAGDEVRRELFAGAAGLARSVLDPSRVVDHQRGTDPDFASLYGLYWLLAALTDRAPLVVTIDDAHWADRPSLRFLSFLARRVEGLRLAVVLTARPRGGDVDGDVLGLLGADVTDVVRLKPLSRSAIAAALDGTPQGVRPGLVDAIERVTGGVPFYLRAVLDDPSWSGEGPDVADLTPRSVASALRRRLSSLPALAGPVAEAVAVLDEGTSPVEVAALLDKITPEEVGTVLPALVAEDILRADERLGFVHPIVRSAIYTAIEPARRGSLHARAAQLELASGEPTTASGAAHLLRAPVGSVGGADEALEAAAHDALNAGAPDVAVTYLRRALAECLNSERRALLASELGRASARAGLPQAEAELRSALDLAREPGRRKELARDLARLLGATGRSADAIQVLAGFARQCLQSRPDLVGALQAEVLAIGDLDLSVREVALSEAAALGPLSGDRTDATGALLLAHRATSAVMSGATAESTAQLASAALAHEGLLDAGVAGVQLSFLAGYFLMCADRFDEAEQFFDSAISAARRSGSAAGFSGASAWRSLVAHRRGDLVTAAAHARASLEAARPLGLQVMQVTATLGLAWTLVDRDEADDAAAEFERVQVDPTATSGFLGAALLDARGRIRIASGHPRAGVQDLLESGRRLVECGLANPACFPWRSGAALGLAELGEHDEALELATKEVQLARDWGAPRALGLALRVLGVLTGGPAGLDLLRESASVLEDSAANLERGRALLELGAALRRAGRRTESRGPLRTALDLTEDAGAPREAARARAELRAAGGRPRSAVNAGPHALTPSEHRIALLAAEGRSNPQIAQDLFVTVKTVEMHLSAAYRKLNVQCRADLGSCLNADAARRATGAA